MEFVNGFVEIFNSRILGQLVAIAVTIGGALYVALKAIYHDPKPKGERCKHDVMKDDCFDCTPQHEGGFRPMSEYNGEFACFLIPLSSGYWDMVVGLVDDDGDIVHNDSNDTMGWEDDAPQYFCKLPELPEIKKGKSGFPRTKSKIHTPLESTAILPLKPDARDEVVERARALIKGGGGSMNVETYNLIKDLAEALKKVARP